MNTNKIKCYILFFFLTILLIGNVTVLAATSQPKVKDNKKTMYVGYNNYQITCNNLTASAKITYTSDNKTIVKVNNKGLVTPISVGNAKITVTIKQGSKTYSSKVAITVKKPYIIITNKITDMQVGESYRFEVKAVGLKKPDITWKVSDVKLGSINNNTGEFLTKQTGQIKVTAKDNNSGRTSVCYLEIKKTSPEFHVTNKLEEYWCNVSYQFKTEGAKKVIWSVSDAKIASIDRNGVFIAKNTGTVNVTAKNQDTGEQTTFAIKTKDIEESPVEIFEFDINYDKNNATILGLKEKNNSNYLDIKIPEKINGIDITSVNHEAFMGELSLRTIIIPASIECVSDWALIECDNLKSIVIQDRKTPLLFYQANTCNNLTEFITPYQCNIKFGDYCFYNNLNLKKIILPENTVELGRYMFGDEKGQSELEVEIPNSITYLCDLFGYVKSLKIVIPVSVTNIDSEIFSGCKDVVIYTPKNSTAEQFAKDNDIRYINY